MKVYKPPNTCLQQSFIPCLEAPALYVGDFNSIQAGRGNNDFNGFSLGLNLH